MRKWHCMLAAAVGITLCVSLAAAHSALARSSPAAGSVLKQAPKEIRLSFNEKVEPRFSSITLTKSDGGKVETGSAAGDARKRTDLVLPVTGLQPGKYRVQWQVTSADTHRINGSFGFEIRL
jgi:methionine-rich copper-binding protein CopC